MKGPVARAKFWKVQRGAAEPGRKTESTEAVQLRFTAATA